MRGLLSILGLAFGTLIAAACSSPSAPALPLDNKPVDCRSALKFGFAGYMGEFPATIANGHHGGAFMTWVTPSEFTTHGSTLFDKYKDTRSPDIRTGLKPCILGAIAGNPLNHGFRIDWEVLCAEENDNRVTFVVQARLQFDISELAPAWGGYAIDLARLPEGVSRVVFHFKQIDLQMNNGEPPVEYTPFPDFEIDISALKDTDEKYSAELRQRRRVVQESPEKTYVVAWEVAQNWRGIEILDGEMTYKENGAVKSRWNFTRGYQSGGVLQQEKTSYETKGGEWVFLDVDVEGELVDGRRDGLWKATYAARKPCYERQYRNGVMVSGKQWYPDGSLQCDATVDGEAGISRYYDAWGRKTSETEFRGNKKDGYQRDWWGNGQLREERWYEMGKPVGVWRRWDHEGKLTQEESNPPWKR